jgi:transposase-like protein
MSALSARHFHNEKAAYAYVEARIWANGIVCPHCGGMDRIGELKGSSTRIGVRKCYDCRKPFTVKIGTIFEASHVPLRFWLQAIYLMAASKKGFSANQLHRTLGVTLKTAWFMAHRIRTAMASGELSPFGGGGTPVEADETYYGRDPGNPPQSRFHRSAQKNKIVTLIDRATGRAFSTVVDNVTIAELRPILEGNISREARLMTDDARFYKKLGKSFAEHGVVNHTKEEYVSPVDRTIHTNTVEGFFSIFKRGMRGVYQHAARQNLHRYMAEFDFRYSNRIALGVADVQRAVKLLMGVVGQRLLIRARLF